MANRRPYGRSGPIAYPPIHSHPSQTRHLTREEAQPLVAKYISRTRLKPHYHPDSFLDPDGVKFGPKSGRNGGIVIHYLRRVEVGLRGEHQPLESKEELTVKFGDEQVADYVRQLPAGDDTRVDAVIAANGSDSKKARKGILKRKRDTEDISAWAEASSQVGAPPSSPPAFAGSEMQPLEEYQQEQKEWVGEVGAREGAPVSKQDGAPPFVVKHDRKGNVQVPQSNGPMSAAERRAAKKLRVNEYKKQAEEARKSAGGTTSGQVEADAEAEDDSRSARKQRVHKDSIQAQQQQKSDQKRTSQQLGGNGGATAEEDTKAAKRRRKMEKKAQRKAKAAASADG